MGTFQNWADAVTARTNTYEADVPSAADLAGAVTPVLNNTYGGQFNAHAYGAMGDGTTDDTAALQAAINAAGGGVAGSLGGAVVLPPGQYLLTAPLTWHVNNPTLSAVPGPSIIGLGGPPGRIGDQTADANTVNFICKPGVFPTGQYVIDYTSGATTGNASISGVHLRNFGIKCNQLGAGIRLASGRRCRLENINVDRSQPPTPTVPSPHGGDDGAFTLTQNATGAAAAYNVLENCLSSYAGKDAFHISDYSASRLVNCFAYSPVRYGLYMGYQAGTSTAFHCEIAGAADIWTQSNGNTFIGSDFFVGPNQSNVIINGWSDTNIGAALFVGCNFVGTGTVSATQTQAMIQAVTNHGVPGIGNVINALFSGCSFYGMSQTSAYLYVESAVTGTIDLRGCTFSGTPTVAPYVLNGFLGLRTDQHEITTAREPQISSVTTLTTDGLGKMHACTVTAPYTLTLPTPVGVSQQQIAVRVRQDATALLTLATAGGNIEGQATRVMWAGESAILESDGTNWVKIGGKTIPMNCQIFQNTGQTLPDSTFAVVTVDITHLDNTGLMASPSTNQINVLRPGLYAVTGRMGMSGAPAAASRSILNVKSNGSTLLIQDERSVVTGTNLCCAVSTDVALSAGDYVQLSYRQACGSGWDTVAGAGANACGLIVREMPAW
jgi:uncharacterized protein YjbI with pentapeptide repeats